MRNLNGLWILALVLIMATAVQADVVITMKSSTNTMGLMNADGTATQYVKPDMSAIENSIKITGGMAAMFGDSQEQKTADIERLDKGIHWTLDLNEKEYQELQLAELKKNIEGEEGGENDLWGEAENYDWTMEITKVDEPKDINGFKCKGLIFTAKGVRKQNPQDKTDLTLEYWYTKDVEGYDVLKEYEKNYLVATGMNVAESKKDVGMIFGKLGANFEEITKTMQQADGFPIKTSILVKGSSVAAGDVRDEETQKGAKPGTMDMFKGLTGGQTEEKSPDGMTTLMSITNEVQSIKQQSVDQAKYEVPEGFKKQ